MSHPPTIAKELRAHFHGRQLTVKVIPKASKTELAGTDALGFLRVRLKARPEKGEANRALVEFVSKALGSRVRLVRGASGRMKTLEMA